MQALMNVTRTSVTLATPHATHAAMGVAVAISAPGIRNLGTKGAAAAAVTLNKCNPRDAVVRAYSVAPDTGAHCDVHADGLAHHAEPCHDKRQHRDGGHRLVQR